MSILLWTEKKSNEEEIEMWSDTNDPFSKSPEKDNYNVVGMITELVG